MVSVGDPITAAGVGVNDLIFPSVGVRRQLYAVVVSGTPSDHSISYMYPGNSCDTVASMELEGKAWIRGHHDENSEEGQALLAAHALCDGV